MLPATGHQQVVHLLAAFREAGIAYCHFKSNEHVAEGIRGETDLDILIDRTAHQQAQALMTALHFKRFRSHNLTGYPAVEDWIGFDPNTGKLAHLHIHWQMIAGEPYLKGYRIPWERRILQDRIWREDLGIFTASVEMELLLLLVRAAVKYRQRAYLHSLIGRVAQDVDMQRERLWLLARIDEARFGELAQAMLPEQLAKQLVACAMNNDLNSRDYKQVRRGIVDYLSLWRSYSPLNANVKRWSREVWRRVGVKVMRRIGGLPMYRRSPATGGLLVALIGADGSGKSTQTQALFRWLDWKVDVARIYLGSGDGPLSWHRALLRWLADCIVQVSRRNARSANRTVTSKQRESQPGLTGGLRGIFHGLYAISLALEKRRIIRNAIRSRNRGLIVISDRYPQNQIPGYNDGPLLSDWLEGREPWRTLARLEARLRAIFTSVTPDLVIKLNVSESVAASRKADTPPDMIGKKIAAVRHIKFGPESHVIELDADQSTAAITLAVQQAVWQQL